MDIQNMICISCPMGCELTVKINGDDIEVSGHVCKRGITYGKDEATNPRRNIATSVFVDGGDIPMLSVKNLTPIPKGKIMDCVRAVKAVRAAAPVKVGDVVAADVAGTGIDFVATRDIVRVS